MTLSKVFCWTLDAYLSGKYTIISNRGGTRSGKTFSMMQLLYFILISENVHDIMISVVSRTVPHLKRGVIRDFESILNMVNNAGLVMQNKTDRIYHFQNNNRIEFFSADDTGKLHGSSRNILFINEANYIDIAKIKQLFVRTTGTKFIDYNPSGNFWIDDYRDRSDFIEFHSTYKDNDFLTDEQVAEIESNKNNPSWWSIYGEGNYYKREGLCFPNVNFITDHEWNNPIYAMDWGYNDPTVLLRVEVEDNKLFVQELLYKKHLDITYIKGVISDHCNRNDIIIADSAEPQIIAEIKRDGYAIKKCIKGKNSILEGIQLINGYDIYCVGSRTSPTAYEFNNYSYEQNDDGVFLDKAEDKNNHAMDALRYAVSYLRGKKSGNYNYSFI